jgi:hypothetical protein
MRNIAIEHGTGAREAGRYRAGTARPTNGVVARIGVVAGVVAGIPLMDAHPATRYRAETAHPTDLEDKAGRDLNLLKDEAQRIAMLGSWHARHRRAELPLSAATRHVRVALGLSGRDNRTTAKQRRYRIKPDLPRKACNGREYLNS